MGSKISLNPQKEGLNTYKYPPFLPHAGGGTLGVKKTLYESIGGFDDAFPYLHDTDFCWRLQLAGTQLHFIHDALLHVRYRNTLKGIYRQSMGYAVYNVLLYKKYRPLGMPKLQLSSVISKWAILVKRIPHIHSKAGVAAGLWLIGRQFGRIRGSIKYKTFAP